MNATAEKPEYTPIPVQLSEKEFNEFILPHLSEKKLDLSVLHGDATNTVAKKGEMGLVTQATSIRRGRKLWPSLTTMDMCYPRFQ